MNKKDIAVKVENISKYYRIGAMEEVHDTFAAAMLDLIKSPLKNYKKYRSLYKFDETELNQEIQGGVNPANIIWPVRNVSFEVERGEAFGIIGANGAGKSTLLKILARITTPNLGRAEIRGRISSLLEVGTGFHQELTGRENIYLNGTILGMTKDEVKRKFDEIVDFSGVEKFLDTPVKRYSSGMRVRLAFSVAAHLEPEILIIDEVLAVGDAAFQQKCIGKMGSVASEGRTVLFVSHNMGAVSRLCDRVAWLNEGQIKQIGPAQEIVSSYLSAGTEGHATWKRPMEMQKTNEVQFDSARLLSADNTPTITIGFNDPLSVEIAYTLYAPIRNLSIVFRIADSEGNYVFESFDTDTTKYKGLTRDPGKYMSICKLPGALLKPGRYHLSLISLIFRERRFELLENLLTFDITDVGYTLTAQRLGAVTPVFKWQVQRLNNLAEVE